MTEDQDRTKEVALNYSKSLPLRILETKEKIVAYQRNFGAKQARGKYLVFFDADTRIASIFTKKLQKYILTDKGLIFIPYAVPDEKDSQIKILFNFANFLIEISQYSTKPFSAGGNIISEKELFLTIDGFPEDLYLGEDHAYVQKAADWGVRAKFLRQIKFIFCLRRMRKEGRLKHFYRYLLATAHILFKGKINKKIFSYEMGGQLYLDKGKKAVPEETLKKYLKQAKDFFDQLF